MENSDYCLAFECPIDELPADALDVCHQLGDDCETCDHRSPWCP